MKRLLPCMIALLFMLALISFCLAATVVEPLIVSIDKIVFAQGIESREPVGVAREFDSSVAQVYCWTKLSTKSSPVTVKHVWYHAGQKAFEVLLTINYSSGRYWSAKNVSTGDWTVEVVSANGEVIGAASFKVRP